MIKEEKKRNRGISSFFFFFYYQFPYLYLYLTPLLDEIFRSFSARSISSPPPPSPALSLLNRHHGGEREIFRSVLSNAGKYDREIRRNSCRVKKTWPVCEIISKSWTILKMCFGFFARTMIRFSWSHSVLECVYGINEESEEKWSACVY